MSLDDQDPTPDGMSRIEEREQLLAETLAHAEAKEKRFRLPPTGEPRPIEWKAPLALLVLATAGLVALFPPAWTAGAPPPSVQPAELERGMRAAIYLQAMQVEVYRLRNGRLPESLSELPTPFPELRLVRSNNRVYQILGRGPGGDAVVYDSARPEPAFAAAASAWTTEGAP